MFYLKNLSSSEIFTGNPWDKKVKIPEKVRADKKLRDEWINRPTTSHCVYTFWEGLNPKLRVSTKKNSDNPPAVLWGLVFDLDPVDPMSEKEVRKIAENFKWPVAYLERTLTEGHWRMIVLFERELVFASSEAATHFLKQLLRQENLTRIPALDKSSFTNPTRLWTSSGDFIKLSDKKVDYNTIHGKYLTIFEDYKWNEFKTSWTIPAEVLEEALAAKYPNFQENWPGKFDFEAQGPTFWIPESTSPKSAIIKPQGIYTFSDHAAKPFYTWAELLGGDFVKEYEESTLSQSVENIFRAGHNYYRKMTKGNWSFFREHEIVRHLRVKFGLSDRRDDSGRSPIDRALEHICEHNTVEGAGSFVFFPDGLIEVEGLRYLNTCTTKPLKAADGPVKWGPDGQFPWLSKFFDGLFTNEEAKMRFLYWAAYAYRSFVEGDPKKGHAIFLMGGARVGKTFVNSRILPTLFGGGALCKAYITGDQYSGEIWSAGHFHIDDGDVVKSRSDRKQYTEAIKSLVANIEFRFHKKFETPLPILWHGRFGGTGNDDPESLRANIPFTDQTLLDKVMFFRCVSSRDDINFDQRFEAINNEMPFFARYLLDLEIPEDLRAPVERFGVLPYHDESILQACHKVSSSSIFGEMLNKWKATFFDGNSEPYYEGTAMELLMDLEGMYRDSPTLLRTISREDRLSIELEKLVQVDPTIECFIGSGYESARWRIYRDADAMYERENKTESPLPPKKKDSKFQRNDSKAEGR